MFGDIPVNASDSSCDVSKTCSNDTSHCVETTSWESSGRTPAATQNHVTRSGERRNISPVTSSCINVVTLNYNLSRNLPFGSHSAHPPIISTVFPARNHEHDSLGHIKKRKSLYAAPRGFTASWASFPSSAVANSNSTLERCYVGGKGFSRFLKEQIQWHDKEDIASTTPASAAAPFSTTTTSQDLISSYPGAADPLRLAQPPDDLRIGSLTDRDVARWKTESSKRPPSHKDNRKPLNLTGKGSLEKEKESSGDSKGRESRASPMLNSNNKLLNNVTVLNNVNSGATTTTAGANQFKGLRNNFLSGQQIPAVSSQQRHQHLPPQPPTKDRAAAAADDLIAMGSSPWNPNGQGSGKEPSLRNGRHQAAVASASNLLPVTASRKIGSRTNVFAPTARPSRSDDCRYVDPLPGAPSNFQQRISEIATLEQETIRWEKQRKFKKKTKEL